LFLSSMKMGAEFLLAAGIMLAVGGCSKKEAAVAPAPEMPDKPTTALVTPDPGAQLMTESTSQAIKKKNYNEAVLTLIEMSKMPQMTPQQAVEFRNLRVNLQTELANAAAAGDQKAMEAIALLRMASSGPH
jgi:hypothetical protein